MALPPGIQTCTVNYGRVHASLGSDATLLGATVATDRVLVWSVTGDALFPMPDALVIADGVATGEVPFVDQGGFVDSSGQAITGWAYILDAALKFPDGRRSRVRKVFQVFVGQDNIDLDLVPDGEITDPVVAPAVTVTSVIGITGAVGGEALAEALEPFLPGGGEGEVQSVNGKAGAVVLDATDVGAKPDTYVPSWTEVTGKPTFSTVATSGSYADLSNKPTIPTTPGDIGAATAAQGALADSAVQPSDLSTVATSGAYTDLSGRPTLGTAASSDTTAFATAAQGAKADTAVQPGSLSTVATTGAYTDLSGRPTLGSAASADASSFATAAQGAKADTAVQPNALSPVATSGAYGDLTGRPTLGTAAAANASDFATAAQGATADTAMQPGDAVAQSRDGSAVMWSTSFTGTLDSSATESIAENAINGVVRSWLNEWGGMRGRNPYPAYADALARAIVETGDYTGTGGGGGNAFEIVDRRLPAGVGRQRWGRRWEDGTLIRNGLEMADAIVLGAADPVPTDLPAGTLIARPQA